MRVHLESPNQPEIILLIEALDAYQDELYPPEARYALNMKALEQCNVLLAVARDATGVAIGCAAALLCNEAAELKRMFVQPCCRGQGAAAKVLAKLEFEVIKRGGRLMQLETGIYQPEALGFYQKHGYEVCGPFGDYPEHRMSVFMEKKISNV